MVYKIDTLRDDESTVNRQAGSQNIFTQKESGGAEAIEKNTFITAGGMSKGLSTM